jgi:hypothetical protein
MTKTIMWVQTDKNENFYVTKRKDIKFAHLMSEVRIKSEANPCGICGRKRGTETGFLFSG